MIRLFGKQGYFLVPKLSSHICAVGLDIMYTKPSVRAFYSYYGFAYPLDYNGYPFHLHFDKNLLVEESSIKHFDQTFSYLLVDHKGNLWKAVIKCDEEGKKEFFKVYIDTLSDGWWVVGGHEEEVDYTKSMLTGFLYTDPSDKAIKDFSLKYLHGITHEQMVIADIVKSLNDNFDPLNIPIEKKEK